MSAPEYFVPTVASRARAIASTAAFVLWAVTHQLWLAPLVKQIDTCAVCSTLWAARAVGIYIALLPLAPCLWFTYTAAQILKSGQNPPPSSWLLFKVRMYRGRRAKIGAYALAVAAFVLALTPGLLAYQFGFAYLFCIAEDCGCDKAARPAENACKTGPKHNEA